MLAQIRRLLRAFVSREVVGRSNDGWPRVLADADGDHVLLHAMAGPDAGIEAIADRCR